MCTATMMGRSLIRDMIGVPPKPLQPLRLPARVLQFCENEALLLHPISGVCAEASLWLGRGVLCVAPRSNQHRKGSVPAIESAGSALPFEQGCDSSSFTTASKKPWMVMCSAIRSRRTPSSTEDLAAVAPAGCIPEFPRAQGAPCGVQGCTPLAIDATIRRRGEQF